MDPTRCYSTSGTTDNAIRPVLTYIVYLEIGGGPRITCAEDLPAPARNGKSPLQRCLMPYFAAVQAIFVILRYVPPKHADASGRPLLKLQRDAIVSFSMLTLQILVQDTVS